MQTLVYVVESLNVKTSRMINIILSTFQDKNTHLRAYSGTWIHISLLRYQNNFQKLEVLNNITRANMMETVF